MKRLKDKVWRSATIKIDRLVEQYTNGIMTENRTVAYLVEIDFGYSKTLFRADTKKDLYKIEQLLMLHKCEKANKLEEK